MLSRCVGTPIPKSYGVKLTGLVDVCDPYRLGIITSSGDTLTPRNIAGNDRAGRQTLQHLKHGKKRQHQQQQRQRLPERPRILRLHRPLPIRQQPRNAHPPHPRQNAPLQRRRRRPHEQRRRKKHNVNFILPPSLMNPRGYLPEFPLGDREKTIREVVFFFFD